MKMLMAAAILCTSLATAAAGLAQVTFKSGIDLVSFAVTAVDKKGEVTASLSASDFEILEDGQRQDIRLFLAGSAETPLAGELHLGVLFDISGSMDDDLRMSKTAAIRFLNTFTDAVDMTLVDFDSEVRVARYGQAEFPRLVERLRNRRAEGYTALWDALGVYLDGATGQDGRKILVMYTDGADTSSEINFGDALTLLRASDVTVYTIGFLERATSNARMDQRMRLQEVADVTGGQAFFPSSVRELDDIYKRIEIEIRAQYVLGYLSSNPATDGRWRKVEVRLTRPDLKDLKLRTRKGYFAPYRPARPPSATVPR